MTVVCLTVTEAKHTAFEAVGMQIMACQLVAFLEVIHPLLGLVRTGVFAPLAQVRRRTQMIHPLLGLVRAGVHW